MSFKKRFNTGPKFLSEHHSININSLDITSNSSNGYIGWKLYFQEDYTDVKTNLILLHIKLFEKFLQTNLEKFSFNHIRQVLAFHIDLNMINNDEELTKTWPTFGEDFISNSEEVLACCGLAMHQTIVTEMDRFCESNDNMGKDIPQIHARIINNKPILNIKEISVEYYGKLVTVRGTVTKSSPKKLLFTWMTFKCSKCGGCQLLKQIDYKFTIPRKCLTTGCKKTLDFEALLSSPNTKCVESQIIKIQEFSHEEEIDSNGSVPHNIKCNLTNDLINSCTPGDDVIITGVLMISDDTVATSSTFSTYLDVISVINEKKKAEPFNTIFTNKDYYAIREIQAEDNLLRLLVHSLCPNIFGHEIVKAGLLLAMFAGNNNSKQRSNSHVLIVGDPGLGKSQMLKACSHIAPRGMYICGTSSTNAGLTVGVTRENDGEYAIEAGALLLSDLGCCCIDEFDKMSQSHQASLLEVMEQQSVSLAKAGIVCMLPARSKVLAAANPVNGHYNKSKTLMENLNISQPMLSRFDLVFLLLDEPDEQHDALLSDHIIALRTRGLKMSARSSSSGSTINMSTSTERLKDKLKLRPNEKVDTIPSVLLKKYIIYADKYVHPVLIDEAKLVLKTFYLELYRNCKEGDSIPVSIRMLESMKRLTEARAKLELREEATKDDALEVVEIMRNNELIFTGKFTNLKELTLNRQNKTSVNKKNFEFMVDILKEKLRITGESKYHLTELKAICNENKIDTSVIDLLNTQGYLLMKGNKIYQFHDI